LRREYDEYIAYADAEFGRFFNNLEREGILDDTWVIFTSDHGEMFERGIFEHNTETLYQPLLRVPLLISEPGQSVRKDIYKTTSSVDLLPTLSKLCGFNGPGWSEGITLPLYRELGEEKERNIYAVEAKSNPKVGPLRRATVAMMKEQYKIIKYWGYPEKEDFYEVFDLANDPEELDELSLSRKSLALELLRELELKVDDVNSDQAEQ
jgi:arylsulfatase